MSLTSFLTTRGVHARAYHPIIGLLATGWQPLDALVRASTLPRRSVEDLLTCDDVEHRDKRWRLACPVPVLPPRGPLDALPQILADVPTPLRALDHVQADLPTVIRRAEWLDDTYELSNAHLVCIGDHDLTALATCLARPGLRATVIDVDDRLLAYVDSVAHTHNLPIRCLHADFRFALPPSITATADLVFTDPPYTPEGMRLFLTRGAQALRDGQGRILAAYGFSPLAPALGLKVQREILSLGLAMEAVIPAFNRYHGAQAVGSAADLYVLQPTSAAPKASSTTAIYTHGPQSPEATTTPTEAVAALMEMSEATSLTPPDWSTPYPTRPLAFDLTADPGSWLSRVLIAAPRKPVTALVRNNHPDIGDQAAQQALKDLVSPKFTLKFHRSIADGKHAIITATPTTTNTVAAALLDRPHGKLTNIWREALITHTGPLTKREAKTQVTTLSPTLTDERLIDLPRHQVTQILTTPTPSPHASDHNDTERA